MTGGAGYVGSALVPTLLEDGYDVTVFDLFIYGKDALDEHPNLRLVEGDIRNEELLEKSVQGHDCVIHLACISNDPSFELNAQLGKEINLDAFRPLVKLSKDAGVSRFIYASSSSVYGVKNVPDVNESMSLEPLTDYSIFKAECEAILSEYQSEEFTTVTIRPATVCGYARRQRLDVVVNILSNLAYHNREITIFGGDQLRPNINILDMVRAYQLLIEAPKEKVAGEIFNAGFENHSVRELGNMVQGIFGDDVELKFSQTDDNRSYHISSKKISNLLGFEPEHSIEDAIVSLKNAFEQGVLVNTLDNEMYFNIKRMNNISMR